MITANLRTRLCTLKSPQPPLTITTTAVTRPKHFGTLPSFLQVAPDKTLSDMWTNTSCFLPRNFSDSEAWNSAVNWLCTHTCTISTSWGVNSCTNSSEIHYISLLKGAYRNKSSLSWLVVKSGTHPYITCLPSLFHISVLYSCFLKSLRK